MRSLMPIIPLPGGADIMAGKSTSIVLSTDSEMSMGSGLS